MKRRKINRQKEKSSIVQSLVDDIILQKNNKLSAENEAHGNIDYEINDNDIYEIDNTSLYKNK